ncbi:hypothetical protein D6745_03470 [Candidatus Woesearchaeota archaeon]|nr:MAG: hypothetical protein D6745_03470 [Candidatus Woesearchaeota archaeon]
MGLIKWAEKGFRKFSLFDIAVWKIDVALGGIIIGAFISEFVKKYMWYFVAVFAMLYVYLLSKMFKK